MMANMNSPLVSRRPLFQDSEHLRDRSGSLVSIDRGDEYQFEKDLVIGELTSRMKRTPISKAGFDKNRRGEDDDFESFALPPLRAEQEENPKSSIVIVPSERAEPVRQATAKAGINPQRTATAAIKLAPSPKVPRANKVHNRTRSNSPESRKMTSRMSGSHARVNGHSSTSSATATSRVNLTTNKMPPQARPSPGRPAPQRSISLQATSTARKPLNTNRRAPPPSSSSTSSSVRGSNSSLASSVNSGSGRSLAPPAPNFNRSISADPNDPAVLAKIGNRATKTVQRSIGKCGACNKAINEDGCTAFGKVYHKSCFKCAVCKQKIQGKFFEKDGKPYCAKDFQANRILKCDFCDKDITNKMVTAFAKNYHVNCLKCHICKKVLKGAFYLSGKNFICAQDAKSIQESCNVCRLPIKGDSVVSNNKVFHPECMKCYICGESLRGTYFTFQDQPICERDYKQHAEKCHGCGEGITGTYYSNNNQVFCESCHQNQAEHCPKCDGEVTGKVVKVNGGSFHPECFVCTICKKSMISIPFIADNKMNIYCPDDYNNKKAPRCSFCKKPIVPKEGQKTAPRLRVMGRDFHPKCFQCEDCGLLLDSKVKGRECYPFKNHVLCKKCNRKKLSSSESESSDEDDEEQEE